MYGSILCTLSITLFAVPALAADNIELQENFDLNKYLGHWFEIYRTKNVLFEFAGSTDNEAYYSLKDEKTVNVTNRQYFPERQEWDRIEGTATIPDPNQPARFSVVFFPVQTGADYRVLYTDYNQISVVYSQNEGSKSQFAWILGRSQNISQDSIDKAFEIYKSRTGLTKEEFLKTPTGKVSNAGQHDERAEDDQNIPLQPDFDLNKYLGHWYEIYRTKNVPFESRDSTDNEANYSLRGDNTVNVTNRQYFPEDKEWDTIEGTARVVRPARLAVSFFPGQPGGDYRVLFTDYTQISVVYSQEPMSKTQFAWILARTQNPAEELIDQAFKIFKSRTGLVKRKFLKTKTGVAPGSTAPDQKSEAKEENAKEGDEIPLQKDFDIKKYMGKWFENYRTKNIRFESGTDVQAIYTLKSDGTVNVTNRQYFPDRQEWDGIEGTATIPDQNQPARLSVKFFWWQPGGDYRVLYTDYGTVAVVYSEAAFMGLFKTKQAWILGRQQNLSEDRIKQAFEIFENRTTLVRDDFLKTPTGQAPSLDRK